MLSHDSMTYAARQNVSLFNMEYAKETTVSYLPQVRMMMMVEVHDRLYADYIFSSLTVAHSRDDDGHLQHDPDGRHLLLCRQERVEGNSPGKHPALQVRQRFLPTWRTVCELDGAAWYCVHVI